MINEVYALMCPIRSKVASVYLESFLFFSGFYSPLRMANQFPNIAEVIRLIMRDEAMHGTYVGHKFKKLYDLLPQQEQDEIKQWANEFLFELYMLETSYTEEIYDEIGWSEDVKRFVEYNANKALSNMGLDQVFSTTMEDVNPVVMRRLDTSSANHDFFSMVGNAYIIGKVEVTKDEDYDILTEVFGPVEKTFSEVETSKVKNVEEESVNVLNTENESNLTV